MSRDYSIEEEDIIIKVPKAETGQPEQGGKDPVKKRKLEYQKLESEGFELVVSTPGAFIGKTRKGVVIKNKGVVVHEAPLNNLQHIFVTSPSVTLSSNVVAFCAEKKIPIDFMEHGGMPYARLYPLQAGNVPLQLAQLKAVEDIRGAHLAKTFVHGKIKNQINLVKYYHKYRKSFDAEFVAAFNTKVSAMDGLAEEAKELSAADNETLRGQLFSIEGRAANEYWQLATILLDGVIVFDGRERQGATDLVNSLLNYGYGILYSKIWNAVIRSGLSPYISYLHKPQSGKPTLIFDLIEEFRSQAVDRVVFSMINKGVEFTREDDILSVDCRNKLATGVLERINTIENFRGKEQRLIEVIKGQARAVGDYLLGESSRYAPYIGKW
ncbi:MAG: CRISPR-associated endonuclease Cas1 [Pedobacter sp.]